ncbi:MAG: amidohydrolase [Bacteroidia bacterium]|nr:amidohydrolase [Bacteroidia bacterium]
MPTSFPSDLRITIIQTELYWEDPFANRQMFERYFDSIIEQTDIIVLPEMFTTGFTMNAIANAEEMKGETLLWMQSQAKKKNGVIIGSLIILEKGKYFNRLIWMKPDGESEWYDKRHLFRLSGEEKVFSHGNKKMFATVNGWKICPLICYDLRFPVWSRRTAKENYDVIIFTANWPERRINAWKQLLPARAVENQAYVVGVNRIGNDGNGIYHSGDSIACNYRGEKVSKIKSGEKSIETVSFSYSDLEHFRNHHPFDLDADDFTLMP